MNAVTPPGADRAAELAADPKAREWAMSLSKFICNYMRECREIVENAREKIAYTRGEREAVRSVATMLLARSAMLADRVAALEAKVAAIGEYKYCGTYEDGKIYRTGNQLTHDGSLWIALKDTTLPPGGNEAWQLMVRKGRDAR